MLRILNLCISTFVSYLPQSAQTERNQIRDVSGADNIVDVECGSNENPSDQEVECNSTDENPNHVVDIIHEGQDGGQVPNGSTAIPGPSTTINYSPEAAERVTGRISNMLSPVPVFHEERDQLIMNLAIALLICVITLHYDQTKDQLVPHIVAVILCGLTLLWNGLGLRRTETVPWLANILDLLGAALIFGALCGLIYTYVQPNLRWLPCLCWLLFLGPLVRPFFSCGSQGYTEAPVSHRPASRKRPRDGNTVRIGETRYRRSVVQN